MASTKFRFSLRARDASAPNAAAACALRKLGAAAAAAEDQQADCSVWCVCVRLGGSRTRRVRWPLDCIKGAMLHGTSESRSQAESARVQSSNTLSKPPHVHRVYYVQQQEMRPRAPHRAELEMCDGNDVFS